MVLKGKTLLNASTLLAAVGFLLFGYDQVSLDNIPNNSSDLFIHQWF
jgi:hypothetical protein